MDKKILTIGIPTYNRKDFLAQNLDRLIPNICGSWKDIELLISDNASTDGTREILNEYASKYPLRLILKETNTGSADNFATVLSKAEGEFVWVIADDDIVLPHSVETVVDFLKKDNDVSLIHLNNYFFKGEFEAEKLKEPRLTKTETFCTDNKNKFMKCAGCHLTFLSTLIFNKRDLDAVWQTLVRDSDEYFFQTYAAFLCSSDCEARLGYISFPCIAARGNGKVNYNMYTVFGVHLYRSLRYAWTQCNYKKSLLKKQYVLYWRTTAKWGIMGAKMNGYKNMYRGFSSFLRVSWKLPSMWFFVYPFLITPAFLYKAAKKFLKRKKAK